MLAAAAVGNVAARRAGLRGPGGRGRGGPGQRGRGGGGVRLVERHSDSVWARLLRRPGHEIQRVVGTREPTPEQLEVGAAALAEILRVEDAAGAA